MCWGSLWVDGLAASPCKGGAVPASVGARTEEATDDRARSPGVEAAADVDVNSACQPVTILWMASATPIKLSPAMMPAASTMAKRLVHESDTRLAIS